MEDKLKNLYALQQIDSQLQEVHELKGDLPGIVADLEEKLRAHDTKIKDLTTLMKQSKINRDAADVEVIDLQEKVEKYKSQQLHVKSNKQYDALTKEIEMAEARAEKLEKDMDLLEGKMQLAKTDIEAAKPLREEVSADLDEKRKELGEINKEHEDEELRLKHQRDKLLVRIDKQDYERYERIRLAKSGKAVVPIKRGACAGCFKAVPPQKILEIRTNTLFYICEHCGRIIVSDQIVELSSATT